MNKLKFQDWVWPENPETFLIRAERTPKYEKAEDGTMTYSGMSQLSRTITGRGVFQGSYAATYYMALAAYLRSAEAGDLIHPVWGTFRALLTELSMEEDSREDWVVYSFTFQETDSDGTIPLLTKLANWVIQTM